ncbi:MAG: histidine phosphatase family protein [Elusimicrobiota bacterium]|nr:histidine phosphatase family protein [Elusimicrobiota bacterium]
MRKTILNLVFCAAAALACAAPAFAAPAQVIIIRHAEKQEYGNQLSEKGYRRADALVKFFLSVPAVTGYGTPVAIYAAAPKNEDSSIRAIQTVKPLARALGITLNTGFTRGQAHKLVKDIMENPKYTGRMVLVSWQHGHIPDIVRELAEYSSYGPAAQVTLPAVWPDASFDRVWIIDLYRGRVLSFKDIPQRLLPGDSN